MTPRELEEYRALRATIRERGTARVWIFVIGFGIWGGLVMATVSLAALPEATLLPLLALAAVFEAVFALHTGVERVGRYIQVFYEAEASDSLNWEHTAMAFGRAFPSATSIRSSRRFFWIATIFNFIPAVLAGAVLIEWTGNWPGPRPLHRARRDCRAARGPPARHRPRSLSEAQERTGYRASAIVSSRAFCVPFHESVASNASSGA